MFAILVYDIGEKRVAKVLKTCRKYMTWVQNSVFEGDITEGNMQKLKTELNGVIDKTQDSILVYMFQSKKYYKKENLGQEKNVPEIFF